MLVAAVASLRVHIKLYGVYRLRAEDACLAIGTYRIHALAVMYPNQTPTPRKESNNGHTDVCAALSPNECYNVLRMGPGRPFFTYRPSFNIAPWMWYFRCTFTVRTTEISERKPDSRLEVCTVQLDPSLVTFCLAVCGARSRVEAPEHGSHGQPRKLL